jgi:hypothetical protein
MKVFTSRFDVAAVPAWASVAPLYCAPSASWCAFTTATA